MTAKQLQEKRERKSLKRKELHKLKKRVGREAYDAIREAVRARERRKQAKMAEHERCKSPYRSDGTLPPTRGKRQRYFYEKKVDLPKNVELEEV